MIEQSTAIIDDLTFGALDTPKVNNRPKGRAKGTVACNNPHIDFKEVRKRIRRYIGKSAYHGEIIEKAIGNASLVVNSNHTNAIHRTTGHSYRTRIGIERDIAAWIVLFSTVNLTANKDRNWFKCYVNLSRVEEMATYLSVARGSRFLSLYRITDLLRVKYRKSKLNPEQKYCEIFISRKAFELARITRSQLDAEIERKLSNDKSRLARPNTSEFETARAAEKKADRHLYIVQKEHTKRFKKQKQESFRKNQEKAKNEDFKREAIQLLASLQASHPQKTIHELKNLILKKYPIYAHALGVSPPT